MKALLLVAAGITLAVALYRCAEELEEFLLALMDAGEDHDDR